MQILYDQDNPKAVKFYEQFSLRLNLKENRKNIFLVLGGDGFMLRSIRTHYRPDAVFLGLNCGSIGFLLNDIPKNLGKLVGLIRESRYSIRSFPRIEMRCTDRTGKTHEAHAINDIYLERMTGQAVHLRIVIDGMTVVEKMVCDGVILSTALGSTAYNFSASGAACHPSLEVLCITPICPHSPRLGPVILPLNSTISVEVSNPEGRQAQAVADGVRFRYVTGMTVTRARHDVQLAFLASHDYTAAMFHKVVTV